MLSVLPDIDIMIEKVVPSLQHRGPAHSIVILSMLFVPFFVIYCVRSIPYFLALIQHPLFGDFITAGPVQLLWPLSTGYYGILMDIDSPANISSEWVAFVAMLIVMLRTKDLARFFRPYNSSLILVVPAFTVLLPTFLSVPLGVPVWLLPLHLFFVVLFLVAMFIGVRRFLLSVLKR
jgi:hypothetical protein